MQQATDPYCVPEGVRDAQSTYGAGGRPGDGHAPKVQWAHAGNSVAMIGKPWR